MIASDERVLVVGAGVAGAAVARELRAMHYPGAITLLGAEPHQPYDRPPLSKQLLTGAMRIEDLALFRQGELAELDVEVALNARATALDTCGRAVHTAEGAKYEYGQVVIATGSRARRLGTIPELAGVYYLRTLDDSLRLVRELRPGARVVILGAGFIGLEVAAVASFRGCKVTVLEAAPHPLARVLGREGGELVRALHVDHGVEIRCSTVVTGVVGGERVTAVEVDSETISADALLVGVGAVVNTEWLSGSGVTVDDGVVCDASGRTNVRGVFAVGDVSRWYNARTGEHRRVEQWQAAIDQARVVARTIARPDECCKWDTVPYFWSDQYDQKLQMCGVAGPQVFRREPSRGTVLCFGNDGVLTGVLSIGNARALAQGRRLVGGTWGDAVEWAEQIP